MIKKRIHTTFLRHRLNFFLRLLLLSPCLFVLLLHLLTKLGSLGIPVQTKDKQAKWHTTEGTCVCMQTLIYIIYTRARASGVTIMWPDALTAHAQLAFASTADSSTAERYLRSQDSAIMYIYDRRFTPHHSKDRWTSCEGLYRGLSWPFLYVMAIFALWSP